LSVPSPRAFIQFVSPYVPVVPIPPTDGHPAPRPTAPGTSGAPVVAPDTIGAESGVIFEPGPIDATGIDSIFGGGIGQVAVDAPPPVLPAPAGPIVVGGKIKPPARTRYVAPQYPDIARNSRVQGVVILEAVIGADGKVQDLRVLRSIPLLDEAALAAVRAWAYTPTLLNGQPTPVIMTVTVQFRLSQ